MTVNSENSIIKIIDSSGNPLDTTVEGLKQLELMGYRLNRDNCKLGVKNVIDDVAMDDIALMIKRSNAGINIIAHILVSRPDSSRDHRYYFLYNNKITGKYSLLEVLKDFIDNIREKIREENEKYVKNNRDLDNKKYVKINDNKDSVFIFEDLNKVINSNSSHKSIDDNMFEAISKYFDKGRPLQFETDSIEKAVRFLIGLDSKIIDTKKYVYYILYLPTKTRRAINPDAVNISIVQDIHPVDVEPTEDLKKFIQDYKRDKAENEIKEKINKIQNEIEPEIIKSYNTWKDKKIYLDSEIRRRLAENLYPTVCHFVEDIEFEIKSFMPDNSKIKFRISKLYVSTDRRFLRFLQLSLAISIGFLLGLYLPSFAPSLEHYGLNVTIFIPSSTEISTPSDYITYPAENVSSNMTNGTNPTSINPDNINTTNTIPNKTDEYR